MPRSRPARIYLHPADDWLAAQYRKAAEVTGVQIFAGQPAGPGAAGRSRR
jgi:integrase/recombinase XerD